MITAVSPAGTAGITVDITVTTPAGTSPQVGLDTFTFDVPKRRPRHQARGHDAPPPASTANAPFGLTVNAEDGSGNTDATYNGPVTLVLSVRDQRHRARRHRDRAPAVNGVATFTGLTINTVGTGYILTASSSTLTSATSSIDVAATAAPSGNGAASAHHAAPPRAAPR